VTWFEALPAFVAALAVRVSPRLVLCAIGGARGFPRLYVAAPTIGSAAFALLAIESP
jgi:hypothetical protein